jgi:hypothetical protein
MVQRLTGRQNAAPQILRAISPELDLGPKRVTTSERPSKHLLIGRRSNLLKPLFRLILHRLREEPLLVVRV